MKAKLIESLEQVINALESQTIKYAWSLQQSCNCGLVVQALTGKTTKAIEKEFEAALVQVGFKKDDSKTWKNVVQACPISGEAMPAIFKELQALGLDKKDIVHLEYLENPAILSISGIEKVYPRKTTFQKWGWKSYNPGEGHYSENYYRKPKNLILYLKAWVKILKGEQMPVGEALLIEARELISKVEKQTV